MQKKGSGQASVMVDCSHGNSSKNHLNQPKVASDVAKQIAAGEEGIVGIMYVSERSSRASDPPALTVWVKQG